jgi:hypothetical protein
MFSELFHEMRGQIYIDALLSEERCVMHNLCPERSSTLVRAAYRGLAWGCSLTACPSRSDISPLLLGTYLSFAFLCALPYYSVQRVFLRTPRQSERAKVPGLKMKGSATKIPRCAVGLVLGGTQTT